MLKMKHMTLIATLLTVSALIFSGCQNQSQKAVIDPGAENTSQEASDSVATPDSSTQGETDTVEPTTNADEVPAEDTDQSNGTSESEKEPYIWPDFTLTSLDGETSQLYDYKDKIVIINFWATWCTYCKQEMPLIDELTQNEKYHVMAMDVGEDESTVTDYLDANGYNLNVFMDKDQSIAASFGVSGFPTTVFLGPNHEYLYAYPGMMDEKTLETILDALDEYLEP